jgi:hypothetical protein
VPAINPRFGFSAYRGRRLTLVRHPSLPSFRSVRGLFAPGRTDIEVPSPGLTSWKLNKGRSVHEVADLVGRLLLDDRFDEAGFWYETECRLHG